MDRSDSTSASRRSLAAAALDRILVLDGAMGTLIQELSLGEEDYRGDRFEGHTRELKGNHDILALTRPDVVEEIHRRYLEAGADIIETNTFSATSIGQSEYDLADVSRELNREAAGIARRAVEAVEASDPGRPRFVCGVLGPTNRTASISPKVEDPAFRNVTFFELVTVYSDQTRGLIEGGADLLMVETVFDTLNAKAALFAIQTVFEGVGGRPSLS